MIRNYLISVKALAKLESNWLGVGELFQPRSAKSLELFAEGWSRQKTNCIWICTQKATTCSVRMHLSTGTNILG